MGTETHQSHLLYWTYACYVEEAVREGLVASSRVDFDSAPVEAFEELLEALRDSAASEIAIGHDHSAW